jgi:hypothetical protein
MARARRLMLTVALLSVLTVLAFPATGSALRAVLIGLTPAGPAPSVMTVPVGLYPVWTNEDTVSHTVVFANGRCSLQLAPGGYGQCNNDFIGQVGTYSYTMDGTVQASLVITPEGRAIHLAGKSHTVKSGAQLMLHGELDIPILSPPVPPAPQPVIVLARPDRYHAFRRIRVVMSTTRGWHLHWQLGVRPRTRTIYIAEANFQPKGGQYWDRAWSKSFRVTVRPR